MVPRLTFQASGWPAGTEPASVVKSVLEATSIPTVPTRTYRAAGVHTWLLTAEKMPSVTRFSVDANGETCEILIQQDFQPPRPSKGQGKGKHKSGKQQLKDASPTDSWRPPYIAAQVPPKADEDRLGRLESRFDQLEQRQVSFEARVDGKFDHISDSLRQLLAASNPRAREGHGETPPPKYPKQG